MQVNDLKVFIVTLSMQDLYTMPHQLAGAHLGIGLLHCLSQYFSPYVSVDLHRMAVAFNTNVSALEDELTHLILDGQISARIDSHAKVVEKFGGGERRGEEGGGRGGEGGGRRMVGVQKKDCCQVFLGSLCRLCMPVRWTSAVPSSRRRWRSVKLTSSEPRCVPLFDEG